MSQQKFIKSIVWPMGVALTMAFTFQNCSDAKLTRRQMGSAQSFSTEVGTQLPAPILKPERLRVVFLFDQSFSMIYGKCDQDLDGASVNLVGDVTGCKIPPGVDQGGDRFTVMKRWLGELSQMSLYAKRAGLTDAVKVSIIPFSGGAYARPVPGTTERKQMDFADPTDVLWGKQDFYLYSLLMVSQNPS